jgi:hypothetical protein
MQQSNPLAEQELLVQSETVEVLFDCKSICSCTLLSDKDDTETGVAMAFVTVFKSSELEVIFPKQFVHICEGS